ncbi:hypothetical protein ACFTWF_04240 [Rhodococcus sp. NPDC056960]|uniref:hypothetical protein n=1 Tax=Rhodococcus sp. NPDC056960 TaxID=3345982 RepID=UPI00363FDB99
MIIAGLALGIFGGRVGASVVADTTGWRWGFVMSASALLVSSVALIERPDRPVVLSARPSVLMQIRSPVPAKHAG